LIVAGVTLNILTGALTSLALNFAPNPFAAYELMFWLMGSLADRSLDHVAMAAPFVIGGIALLLTAGRALDALALGEDAARSLGL
ncbi:iron chelate uptake ABC transporter family permease subunit, partial [Vibrio parahaemolyticus]